MPLAPDAFDRVLAEHRLGDLRALDRLDTLQINVGKLCNQACKHCHVEAGPHRTEIMTSEIADAVLAAARRLEVRAVDITGGAPELNPHFRRLVQGARALGAHIMVRHNLTVQFEPDQADLPEFFAVHAVEVIASLPYFMPEQTDAQRGKGVFEQSLEAMRRLNRAGYGREGTGLYLNLVYNPAGAFLPPDQEALERDFKRELSARYGLEFNRLYTITNMPIRRFLDFLRRTGNEERYMAKLAQSFNPRAVEALMCRSLLSVGWDGQLYDCDFNQMLELPIRTGRPRHISEIESADLALRPIVTGSHCFGCTAGAGSSCGGAISQ